jgi:hypothetical protein
MTKTLDWRILCNGDWMSSKWYLGLVLAASGLAWL